VLRRKCISYKNEQLNSSPGGESAKVHEPVTLLSCLLE